MPKRKDSEKALTSIRVFKSFIKPSSSTLNKNSNQSHAKSFTPSCSPSSKPLDAEGVISKECYETWLRARKAVPKHPEKAFQKSLTAHLAAVDGRSPFTAEEEAAILRVIRRGGRWPCFEGKDVKYGIMRYRGLGYHERRRVEGAGEPSTPRAGRQGDDDASSGSSGDDDGDRTDEVDNDTSPITTLLPPTNKRPLTGPSSSKPRSYALQLGGSRLTTDAKRPRIEDESADEFEQSLTWHPHALMLWRLSQGLSSFFTATTEAFDRFFAMRRLISIARGKFHSTSKDEIEALFQQECARYPDEGIMIVDPIAKDQRHRIIKTNEMCISMLGRISTEDGGIHRPLFPAESFLTMVKYQILAWCRCGEDVPFEARLYNHSMEIIKVKMTCRVVPQRVVICRGVPI